MEAIVDTSVLLGPEPAVGTQPPDDAAISVVTLAELWLGALLADALDERAARLAILSEVQRRFEALPVDGAVARGYGELMAAARRRGVRPRPFDALIAATAMIRNVPVYTRDRDFARIPGVKVTLVR